MLLAYMVPLRFAYTIQAIVTLAIAGTGVYVLGRVLRLGVIGCVFAATVYELSGPFMAWLGWPQAGTFSWMGWLFAAALIVVRGGRRASNIALFAVVLAFAIYAGFPEGLVLLGLALGVFLLVLLGLRAPRRRFWPHTATPGRLGVGGDRWSRARRSVSTPRATTLI